MTGALQMLTIRVPIAVRTRGGRKLVLTPGGTTNRRPSGADNTLVKALARPCRRRMVETGRFVTLNELAAVETINSSDVSRLLRLTLLAPEIVEAILDGRQLERITLPGLMNGVAREWARPEGIHTNRLDSDSGCPTKVPPTAFCDPLWRLGNSWVRWRWSRRFR